MTDSSATPKTLGDYGVAINKAVGNGNSSTVPPITAEMRAAAPPLDPNAPPPPAPPPVDLGLRGFADALDAAAEHNNVFQIRKIADDMITLQKPTPPAPPPPATGYASD